MFTVPEITKVQTMLTWGWNRKAFLGSQVPKAAGSEHDDGATVIVAEADAAILSPEYLPPE